MVPLSFVSGDTDTFYEEQLTYKGQTLKELPSMYSVEYDAETKFTTLTFKGASLDCSGGAPKKPKSSKSLRR